jgi:hypothetical protein
MVLSEPHRRKLSDCGLTDETTARARLYTGSPAEVKDLLGYGTGGTGLVIPYRDDYARVRIDNPGPDGKRYRSPAKQGNRLYIPPTLDSRILSDPTVRLYVTEGEFKALKATQEGFATVALPGVWSWRTRVHGQSLPIADLDRVVWAKRTVIVVFDADAEVKPGVAWAEHGLCQELRSRGAKVYVVRLPDNLQGERYGFDDYLVAKGADAFRALPMVSILERDEAEPVYLRVRDLLDRYLLLARQPGHRVRSGYPEIDTYFRGVAAGEVLQILGRTNVGKTAFGLNLIERMTVDGRISTLLFSLEQPGDQIAERMASMTLGLTGRELEERAAREDPALLDRLLEVCHRWEHVVVIERPVRLSQVEAVIEGATKADLWKEPLRLVVVDYLGKIRPDGRLRSLYEATSEVAHELKDIAKRQRVALVSLCQVGREGEAGGTPISLGGARDSGVIEEAADFIWGLWRPELAEDLEPAARKAVRGQFVVRILKNRNGPAPKTLTLHFEPTTLRIRPAPGATA